mmetsp:Transcript_26432/g.77677  ORF Transcript_26432/g.77677 Transcript_26432/m.77677 type:complete len:451 (+) Transcript_26432:617-1969(+)
MQLLEGPVGRRTGCRHRRPGVVEDRLHGRRLAAVVVVDGGHRRGHGAEVLGQAGRAREGDAPRIVGVQVDVEPEAGQELEREDFVEDPEGSAHPGVGGVRRVKAVLEDEGREDDPREHEAELLAEALVDAGRLLGDAQQAELVAPVGDGEGDGGEEPDQGPAGSVDETQGDGLGEAGVELADGGGRGLPGLVEARLGLCDGGHDEAPRPQVEADVLERLRHHRVGEDDEEGLVEDAAVDEPRVPVPAHEEDEQRLGEDVGEGELDEEALLVVGPRVVALVLREEHDDHLDHRVDARHHGRGHEHDGARVETGARGTFLLEALDLPVPGLREFHEHERGEAYDHGRHEKGAKRPQLHRARANFEVLPVHVRGLGRGPNGESPSVLEARRLVGARVEEQLVPLEVECVHALAPARLGVEDDEGRARVGLGGVLEALHLLLEIPHLPLDLRHL